MWSTKEGIIKSLVVRPENESPISFDFHLEKYPICAIDLKSLNKLVKDRRHP